MESRERVSTMVFRLRSEKKNFVLQDDVHGHEIMEVTVGIGGNEFGEGSEGVDGHDGHDVLEHRFQPQRREGVGVENRYFGSITIH